MQNNAENSMIPASENRIVIAFFSVFSRFLARRTFDGIYLDQKYSPSPDRSTLFFGNHSSWWDALTPLLLNTYKLKQKPRAVMEVEQVRAFGFFKRIGCFSIDRSDPRSALKSLQYGIDWLNEPGNSLYLYPQGKIENPVSAPQNFSFETGIGWMLPKLQPHVDVVPILQHTHLMYSRKPRLFIRLGEPVKFRDHDIFVHKKTASLEMARIIGRELNLLMEKSSAKSPEIQHWM